MVQRMVVVRLAQSAVVLTGLAVSLLGCGGGGGGGSPAPAATVTATAAPTRTATPLRAPTFTPTSAPGVNLRSVFPGVGPAAGGTALLIEGSGFARGTNTVLVGGIEAESVITLGDRKISCLVPPGQAGVEVDVSVASAGGSDLLPAAYRYAGGGAAGELTIEPASNPSVTFDRQIGTTTVVVDYLVRDSEGVPLDETDVSVDMFVDGTKLGTGQFNESVLDRDSEELDLSVLVAMVLDASFSLQQFSPPQFQPMLQGAQGLVDEGERIWSMRGGEFRADVVWFDELISNPDEALASRFRIAFIPPPQPGNFTKLYGATSFGLARSAALRGAGVAAGPRDQHVLVVFTDGQDNLSSFDNPNVLLEGRLTNGDRYPRRGWRATELEDVFAEIAETAGYPTNLKVHATALGVSCETAPTNAACFDESALSRIAQVGFGQLIASPGDVGVLFEEITKEFTTLQSSGGKMALRPGTYEFRLRVGRNGGNATGELRFSFRVLANGAEFIGFS